MTIAPRFILPADLVPRLGEVLRIQAPGCPPPPSQAGSEVGFLATGGR